MSGSAAGLDGPGGGPPRRPDLPGRRSGRYGTEAWLGRGRWRGARGAIGSAGYALGI